MKIAIDLYNTEKNTEYDPEWFGTIEDLLLEAVSSNLDRLKSHLKASALISIAERYKSVPDVIEFEYIYHQELYKDL